MNKDKGVPENVPSETPQPRDTQQGVCQDTCPVEQSFDEETPRDDDATKELVIKRCPKGLHIALKIHAAKKNVPLYAYVIQVLYDHIKKEINRDLPTRAKPFSKSAG